MVKLLARILLNVQSMFNLLRLPSILFANIFWCPPETLVSTGWCFSTLETLKIFGFF